MAAPARQLHLNAFLRNIGQHEAAWRLPETDLAGIADVAHYIPHPEFVAHREALLAALGVGEPQN